MVYFIKIGELCVSNKYNETKLINDGYKKFESDKDNILYEDFNDDLTFNNDKYNDRLEKELKNEN